MDVAHETAGSCFPCLGRDERPWERGARHFFVSKLTDRPRFDVKLDSLRRGYENGTRCLTYSKFATCTSNERISVAYYFPNTGY